MDFQLWYVQILILIKKLNNKEKLYLVKLAGPGQRFRMKPDGSLLGPGGIRKEDWEKGERPIMNPGSGTKKTPGPGNKLYVQPVGGNPKAPASGGNPKAPDHKTGIIRKWITKKNCI